MSLAQERAEQCEVTAAKMQLRCRRRAQAAAFAAWSSAAQRSTRVAVLADDRYERRQLQLVASATLAWGDVAQVCYLHLWGWHACLRGCACSCPQHQVGTFPVEAVDDMLWRAALSLCTSG